MREHRNNYVPAFPYSGRYRAGGTGARRTLSLTRGGTEGWEAHRQLGPGPGCGNAETWTFPLAPSLTLVICSDATSGQVAGEAGSLRTKGLARGPAARPLKCCPQAAGQLLFAYPRATLPRGLTSPSFLGSPCSAQPESLHVWVLLCRASLTWARGINAPGLRGSYALGPRQSCPPTPH
jgi:hypothetical protein